MPIAAISFRIRDPEAALDGHALRVVRTPDSRVNELLGDVRRQCPPMARCYELQHHVQSGRSAGTRTAIGVHDVDFGRRTDARKPFAECAEALPMQGTTPPVQKPRVRKCVPAEADAAEHDAATCQAAKPLEQPRIASTGIRRARTDQQHVERDGITDRVVHVDVDAIACAHRHSVARDEAPVEQSLTAEPVRRAQRLDRGGERHHREALDQVEADDESCWRLPLRRRPGGMRNLAHPYCAFARRRMRPRRLQW